MIEIHYTQAAAYDLADSAQGLAGIPLSTIPRLAPTGTWLVVFLALMILSVVFVIYAGIRMINRRNNRLGRSRYRLQVINKGNLAAHYLLRAQEPGKVLSFSFMLNGVELEPPAAPPEKQAESTSASQQNKPDRAASSPSSQPGRTLPQSNFMKRTSQFRRASGPFGRIAASLSTLLPKSARAGMYQTSAKFRSAQYKLAQADNLAKEMGAGRAPVSKTSQQPAEKPASAGANARKAEGQRPNDLGWLTTPAMAPGESLAIDLFITPRNPRLSQEYTFKVFSRCAEWESGPESVETCSLQMKGVSWLSYLWPYAALVVSVLAILAIFITLIRTYVLV